MRAVIFISRNKDNKHLPNYKQRKETFASDKSLDELKLKFDRFVEQGQPGELSRFYYGVNDRSNRKAVAELIKYLTNQMANNEYVNYDNIETIALEAAMKAPTVTNKWLFDFDETSEERLHEFIADIKQEETSEKPLDVEVYKTVSGYSVVTSRGFDVRALQPKWPQVELKRDGHLLVDFKQKN